MQEWIIAMLVISALLIIRDMAKTILSDQVWKEETLPLYDIHPQKEKVEKYAESFQKLADTFYGIPYRKDYLSSRQIDAVLREVNDHLCSKCYQRQICWGEHSESMYQGACGLIRAIEDSDEEKIRKTRGDWMGVCARAGQFYEEAERYFQREKQNLIWNNRMIENRMAVAQQMTEISRIMRMVADDLYDISQPPAEFQENLRKKLRKRQVILKNVWILDKPQGKKQAFLTMRARSGQCISMVEIGKYLSESCDCPMTPSHDSRCIVNGEYHTAHFVEDASFQVMHGVARVVKDQEKVSGDNYSCQEEEDGQFIMCLSDGMGSGMEACRESEAVVELLEQFLESGFSQETAARMVNAALVLRQQEEMFSTVDICALDLYSGICNFLKAGAATTFIKRENWVEAITAQSLAAGLVQQMDFETASRKLYDGDFLIMVTDGVLDALPMDKEEETMKEIIMEVHDQTPKELSRGILERVLSYADFKPQDDMTVLVAGVWSK